jgi:putative ABC transport system substrate-binding protein
MRRRHFIVGLAGSAVAWPLAAHAQQGGRVRRVGMLIVAYAQTDPEAQARITAFLDTFQKLGWADGRNVRIEYHWGAGDADRVKTAASELVRSKPDVIVTSSNSALEEVRQLTRTIPIVFTQVSDPVGGGFVAGLARPGGNMTGFQNFEPAMGGKWLGVLKEAAPHVSRAGVLFGSDTPVNVAFLRAAEAVAPSLGVKLLAIDVHQDPEIERAVAALASEPDGGLVVVPHPYAATNRGSIIVLAARYRLPAVYPFRFFATAGGLMSYGIDQIDQWRRAASYVQVRAGGQPQDRQGNRVEYPAGISAARRRGD